MREFRIEATNNSGSAVVKVMADTPDEAARKTVEFMRGGTAGAGTGTELKHIPESHNRWNYKTALLFAPSDGEGARALTQTLGRHGLDGWELCTVLVNQEGVFGIFKRPVS